MPGQEEEKTGHLKTNHLNWFQEYLLKRDVCSRNVRALGSFGDTSSNTFQNKRIYFPKNVVKKDEATYKSNFTKDPHINITTQTSSTKKSSELTWMTTPEKIRRAYCWGLIEAESLTGKAIGEVGKYIYQTAERAIESHIVTNRAEAKIALVDIFQDRMSGGLEAVERLIGHEWQISQSKDGLIAAKTTDGLDAIQTLEDYKKELEFLKLAVTQPAISETELAKHPKFTDLKEKFYSFKNNLKILSQYYPNAETYYFEKLSEDIQNTENKISQIKHLELADKDVTNNPIPKSSEAISHEINDILFHFLQDQTKKNIIELRAINQIVTFDASKPKSKLAINLGELNDFAINAFNAVNDYKRDLHNPITKEHQFYFKANPENEGGLIALDSTRHTNNTYDDHRKWLLGISCIEGLEKIDLHKKTLNNKPLQEVRSAKWNHEHEVLSTISHNIPGWKSALSVFLNYIFPGPLTSILNLIENMIRGENAWIFQKLFYYPEESKPSTEKQENPVNKADSAGAPSKQTEKSKSDAEQETIDISASLPYLTLLKALPPSHVHLSTKVGLLIHHFLVKPILDVIASIGVSVVNFFNGFRRLYYDAKNGFYNRSRLNTLEKNHRDVDSIYRKQELNKKVFEELKAIDQLKIEYKNSKNETKSSIQYAVPAYSLTPYESHGLLSTVAGGTKGALEFVEHNVDKHPLSMWLFTTLSALGAAATVAPHLITILVGKWSISYLKITNAISNVWAPSIDPKMVISKAELNEVQQKNKNDSNNLPNIISDSLQKDIITSLQFHIQEIQNFIKSISSLNIKSEDIIGSTNHQVFTKNFIPLLGHLDAIFSMYPLSSIDWAKDKIYPEKSQRITRITGLDHYNAFKILHAEYQILKTIPNDVTSHLDVKRQNGHKFTEWLPDKLKAINNLKDNNNLINNLEIILKSLQNTVLIPDKLADLQLITWLTVHAADLKYLSFETKEALREMLPLMIGEKAAKAYIDQFDTVKINSSIGNFFQSILKYLELGIRCGLSPFTGSTRPWNELKAQARHDFTSTITAFKTLADKFTEILFNKFPRVIADVVVNLGFNRIAGFFGYREGTKKAFNVSASMEKTKDQFSRLFHEPVERLHREETSPNVHTAWKQTAEKTQSSYPSLFSTVEKMPLNKQVSAEEKEEMKPDSPKLENN